MAASGGDEGDRSRPVVLVTGCSDGGIGHAMARAFAEAGCAVVATARSRGSMRDLDGDPRFLLVDLDVRSEESARAAVAEAVREHGRIDVLVNNAGVHLVAPLVEVPMESFHQVFDTNVYGAMRLVQAVIPHMMERRKGTIVNVGSITAMAPGPWAGVYSASKAALHALSDSLRVELRSFGINVMIVAPGGTKSNLGNKSAAKYDQMQEWKYYKEYEKSLRARTDVSQGPGSTPAEELAKKVVASALKKNPPAWFAYGQFTAILTTLYYTPLWFRDYFYRLVMKS
ncbi:NADPH-dependent 1-acyldihydroxyacetone phosphate reductase [Dichanthelium oligosanthes]|uniref:NADPH-dependent 1-acyldihydroxyacetone phosphate reductase n=1 Tax=Dichanthelium oligosanthes TaxID=888268 RepID=A0A1E5V1Y5_9POAL|nr:NADPH-dependent 1-acyldihydroxyacetone phosphate reductase [Dichanthelium oligosanthes]